MATTGSVTESLIARIAELEQTLEQRDAQVREALDQQSATAEIMAVVGTSAANAQRSSMPS